MNSDTKHHKPHDLLQQLLENEHGHQYFPPTKVTNW